MAPGPRMSLASISLAAALAAGGCHSAPPAILPPAEDAQAVIGPTGARFVFPRDTVREYSWHVPAPGMNLRRHEVTWSISWHPRRGGEDPHAIWTWIPYDTTGARHGTLSEMFREAVTAVMTRDDSIATPASTARYDSAVVATVRDNRVIIDVTGARAVNWIFPERPDSVTLYRSTLGQPQQRLRVAVTHGAL